MLTLRASLRLFKFIPDEFVATHLLQRGVSLRAIQTHLHHASPITTARYTRMTEEVTHKMAWSHFEHPQDGPKDEIQGCISSNSALMINDMLSLLHITWVDANILAYQQGMVTSGTKTARPSYTSALPSLPSIFYGGCCSMCCPKGFDEPGTMASYMATIKQTAQVTRTN